MPETGDLDTLMGGGISEGREMSDEQFREEMRRTQQALQQLQQEEGQVRAQDHNLAQIIVQFLSQPQNTDLFLLISRAIAQNIPSELILAIISLIDQRASKEVYIFLGIGQDGDKQPATKNTALIIPQRPDFQSLSGDQKKTIDNWIQNINQVASKKPHRVLESIIIKKRPPTTSTGVNIIKEISPVLVQLSTFILRNYLNQNNLKFDFQNLHDFMQAVFVEMVKNLEEQVQDQKKLD